MSLLVSFRSETLKLKRTLLLYLCVLAAMFGPFMTFIEYINWRGEPHAPRPWVSFFIKAREPLSIALLPLYVILVCTLLLQIEYRDKTWKQLLASPQKMIDIFLAKFITLQLMILAFIFGYNLFLAIAAFGIEAMRPELYGGGIDYYWLWAVNVQAYLMILGVSAIQFWLSFQFKHFMAPLAIGFGLWLLGPMMVFEFHWDIVKQYPYAFTMLSRLSKYQVNIVPYQWYSIVTALLFLTLGFIGFRIRKVRS